MSYRDLPPDLQSLLKSILDRIGDLERRRMLPPNKTIQADPTTGELMIVDLITGESVPLSCPCPEVAA